MEAAELMRAAADPLAMEKAIEAWKAEQAEGIEEYKEAAAALDEMRRTGPVKGTWSAFWAESAISALHSARETRYPRPRRIAITLARMCRREARAARRQEKAITRA